MRTDHGKGYAVRAKERGKWMRERRGGGVRMGNARTCVKCVSECNGREGGMDA